MRGHTIRVCVVTFLFAMAALYIARPFIPTIKKVRVVPERFQLLSGPLHAHQGDVDTLGYFGAIGYAHSDPECDLPRALE